MSKERRLVALCTSAHLRSWIEGEVSDLVTFRLYAPTVSELIALLSRGVASKPELIVLDLDLLSAPSTVVLQAALDERWWDGTIIGLGSVRGVHQRHLKLDHTIGRPFGSEALRSVIDGSDGSDTQPIVEWPAGMPRKGNGSHA